MTVIFDTGFSFYVHFILKYARNESLADELTDELSDLLEDQGEFYQVLPKTVAVSDKLNKISEETDDGNVIADKVSAIMRLKKL